jgi:hypothetical protein
MRRGGAAPRSVDSMRARISSGLEGCPHAEGAHQLRGDIVAVTRSGETALSQFAREIGSLAPARTVG